MAKQIEIDEAKPLDGEALSYTVAIPFRDKDNFALEYQIGEDVSSLSQDRLDHLLSIGYVILA